MKEFEKSRDLAFALWEPDYELRCQVFSFGWVKSHLIAVGRNRAKTHVLNLRNPLRCRRTNEIVPKTAVCAECDLFIRLRNRTNIPFNKITVVNVRLDRHLNVRNSRPCSSCESLLKVLTPKKLFYTADSGDFVEYS